MDKNLSSSQNEDLKRQLGDAKRELAIQQQEPRQVQINPQDKFIETLFDKGGEIFLEYSKMAAETQQNSTEKELELGKEQLKMIDKLDTKEKIYKGSLLGLCIIALVLSPIFIEKVEIILPVLSLIIGLLFKSSSLSDFFSFTKQKASVPDDE